MAYTFQSAIFKTTRPVTSPFSSSLYTIGISLNGRTDATGFTTPHRTKSTASLHSFSEPTKLPVIRNPLLTITEIGVSRNARPGGIPTQLKAPPALNMSEACAKAFALPAVTTTACASRPVISCTLLIEPSVAKSINSFAPRPRTNSLLPGPVSMPITRAP